MVMTARSGTHTGEYPMAGAAADRAGDAKWDNRTQRPAYSTHLRAALEADACEMEVKGKGTSP